MMSRLQRIVLASAIVAVVATAHAAERVDGDRVADCANERDDARRLACYDEAAAASKKTENDKPASAPVAPSASVTPAPVPAPPAAAAPAAGAESDFGVTGSAVARQRDDEQQQESRNGKAESITAEVTAVSSKPYGELVITLDNGQVWAQKRKERYFAAKPGDKATIDAGMLGSYRMIIGNRSTHVTRIK